MTGFVDFEAACFQDPLIGFAKYPIYDIHPMNRAGLIDSMLESLGFSPRDFAPRLALGCLMTLQNEIPVRPATADERSYKDHVLPEFSRFHRPDGGTTWPLIVMSMTHESWRHHSRGLS